MVDETKRMGEFFFFTHDNIVKALKTNECFYYYNRECEQLAKEFPLILELLEGKHMEVEVTLTQKEREAIKRLVELKREMQDMVEIEHYFWGHRDALRYLMRCGNVC